MIITLTNDFHNTAIRLRVNGERLSIHQMQRARRALCGVEGCICGGAAGERGGEYSVEPIYDRWGRLDGGWLHDNRKPAWED